jgi:hypothetical protein
MFRNIYRLATHTHTKVESQPARFAFIYIDLQTALAAVAYIAEGRWLEEQLNVVKLPSNDRGTYTDTHRQQRDLISLLIFFSKYGK